MRDGRDHIHASISEHLRRVRRQARRLEDAKSGRDAAIRDAVTAGVTLQEVADAAGVSRERVRQIASGER